MRAAPERSAQRDAALAVALTQVPEHGWAWAARRHALLFPGGASDMVEAFFDFSDRLMTEAAVRADVSALRTPERVRAIIALRLVQSRPHRDAIRRAAGVLANPCHAGLAGRCAARTVDAIWHAAGDRSADFSWYTKRATLAAVYSATMLFWLHDAGEDDTATLAFLDRRLARVARIGKLRKRVEGMLDRRLRAA